MLNKNAKIVDINLEHWRRLSAAAEVQKRARRIYLVHEDGKLVLCRDTEKGDLPLPAKTVEDAQALADKIYAENPDVYEVQVVDFEAYGAAQAKVRESYDPEMTIDEWGRKEWEESRQAPGFASAPDRGYLWNGLPLKRYSKFIEKMLPDVCTYVLAAFDGEEIWASLIVSFENREVVHVATFDALDQDDLKEVKGRDQHPFLLSIVTNTFKRPAFGWFCDKQVLEDYLNASDQASMDEIFQTALMEKKATFDFNVLVQNSITPLAPINPGEASEAVPPDNQEQG